MPKNDGTVQTALVIKLTTHGSQEDANKEAASIRRYLEVRLHKPVEVFIAPNLKPKTTKLIPVTWDPMGGGVAG